MFGGGGSSYFDPAVKGIMKAAECGTLKYSNFFLTISTNVVPKNEDEKFEVSVWLRHYLDKIFREWRFLNGIVLKPAGTANSGRIRFPDDNKIVSVNSFIALEQGEHQRGQLHAHVTLEVAHEYCSQQDGAEGIGADGKDIVGVHVNVRMIREYLNGRIPEMRIAPDRRPPKIYVNSQLLTTGTDNSNKFLTYAYLNKTTARDNGGGQRDLVADKARAPLELQNAHDNLTGIGAEHVEGEVEHDSNDYSFEVVRSFPKSGYQPPKKRK